MTQPVVRGAPAVLGAVACSAAGFFFGAGLAGVPVPALTWLAPLPVLLLAPRVGAPVAVGAAFLASLLGATGSWGFFAGSADVPLPVGIGIDLALSAMFAAAVAVFRTVVTRGRPLLGAAAAAATWTAAAFLVQVVNPQGLMGTFANDQGDVPAVLQVAAFTGGWGVELLVLFAPAAVAALAVPGVDRAVARRAAVIGIAVPVLVVGLGAVRLATADSGSRHQVAAVVDNRAGWGADVSTPAGQQLVADYAAQVAALPPGVRTAVLPEGAFTVTPASLGELIDPLAEVARARGTDVVVGYTRLDGGAK